MTGAARRQTSPSTPGGQAAVDRYFDTVSSYWSEVYLGDDLQGLVYRRRQETVLGWVRDLGLPAAAPVLDAGCGAGFMSLALAGESLTVTATDSSPEMVGLCARQVAAAGLADRVRVRGADAHQLPFATGQFSLVVAIGLLPWLNDPGVAAAELSRVLVSGGWLIITADNQRRLNRLVDPRENPILVPLKLARRQLRRRLGRLPSAARAFRHRSEEVDALLRGAGIEPARRATVGYGPFSFMSRPVLPDRAGTRLHLALERAAALHPRLRGVGWHYVVVGRKT